MTRRVAVRPVWLAYESPTDDPELRAELRHHWIVAAIPFVLGLALAAAFFAIFY